MNTRIAGTFADFKLIKGRKVAQIVVEIPIEQADAIVAALGGLPNPAVERWVAMAPVNMEAARAASSETAEQSSNHSAQGEADRFRVSEGSRPASASPASERKPLAPAAQCALRCQEYSFQRFCRKNLASSDAWELVEASGDEVEDIARFVRVYCGVDSRREFSTNREALRRWQTLEADYLHWQREAA